MRVIRFLGLVVVSTLLPASIAPSQQPSGEPAEGAQSTAAKPSWELAARLSYAETSGNSNTSTAGLELKHLQELGRWTFDAAPRFRRSTVSGEVVDEAYHLDLGADRAFGERLGLSLFERFERALFKGIRSRNELGVGLRVRLRNSEALRIDLRGGPTWTREELVAQAPTDEYVAVLIGHDGRYSLSATSSLVWQVDYSQDTSNSENRRLDGRLELDVALNQRFSVVLSQSWEYDNQPPPGRTSTDSAFSAALSLHLPRKSSE